ncbi:plasmid mobilization protein [Flavobacterium daejeonense]|uniref:plasmid mobilization protein n=1 Tax=Flavobacterium daejeonense TaxID=350893 RepID=UPI00047B3FF7|nr:hypothetical protein [Flavobacterium daejeonense]
MKKKVGRPELEEEDKATEIIKFRCSKSEKDILKKNAKSYNLSLSQYLIKKGLDEKIISNRIELISSLDALNLEIHKGGNNINQLAKHANRIKNVGGLDQSLFLNFSFLLSDYVKKVESIKSIINSIYRELSK